MLLSVTFDLRSRTNETMHVRHNMPAVAVALQGPVTLLVRLSSYVRLHIRPGHVEPAHQVRAIGKRILR